jgi:hypothetical protein
MKGTHGRSFRLNSYKDTVRIHSLLRTGGRVAIWIAIGLLLVRGLGAVLSPADAGGARSTAAADALDPAGTSLAVRFARAYLGGDSRGSLAVLSGEARVDGLARRTLGHAPVAQAEVSAAEKLGDGQEVLTVACELRDARTLYLAVPVFRSGAGEVAVQGAPWIVAAPESAGVAVERPRPLAGEDAGEIRRLARKFVPAYLAARSARDLAYLLAPGAEVRPLGGSLEAIAGTSVAQLGDGEGRLRTVVVSGRFRDGASGAVYPLAYRLALERGERWYVRAVEGAPS